MTPLNLPSSTKSCPMSLSHRLPWVCDTKKRDGWSDRLFEGATVW